MQGTHAGHTATLLRASGEVLVTEGYAYMGTELYNPYTNAWRSARFGLLRTHYTATELPSGLVLLAGGQGDDPLVWSRTTSLFDPATGGDGERGGVRPRDGHLEQCGQ